MQLFKKREKTPVCQEIEDLGARLEMLERRVKDLKTVIQRHERRIADLQKSGKGRRSS